MSFDRGNLQFNRIFENYVNDIVINCALLGKNVIITNTTGRGIAVLQYVLICATPGNAITWEDSDGVLLTGVMSFGEAGGMVAGYSPVGHFIVPEGKHLVMNLGAPAQVSGHLTYSLI